MSQAWTSILTPDTADLDQCEKWTMRKLKDVGLHLLSREELESTVPVTLPGEDSPATAYHALFANSGVLPWDIETLQRLGGSKVHCLSIGRVLNSQTRGSLDG